MKLSVVIVNYNTRDDLHNCLTALAHSTLTPEIIVVDNHSHDDSVAMVRHDFPQVKLLAFDENTWYCGGNNHGIDAAQGEYVLLLNPDTVPEPDALERMTIFMDTHPEYAGVTGQLRYPGDGGLQFTCSRVPTYAYLLLNHTPLGWMLRGWRQRLCDAHWYTDWRRDRDYDVQVVPGSCMMMHRDDIRMDADLLLYFPEDDIGQRMNGRSFRFLANARIEHREKSATKTMLAQKIYFRDMLVYTRKHHGLLAMLLLWLLTRPLWWGIRLRGRGR